MQTSYSQSNPRARAGLPGDLFSPRLVLDRVCRGLVQAGRAVFKPPVTGNAGSNPLDPGECYQTPIGGLAANTTAILASGGASSAGIQVVSGAALNGTVGVGQLEPARKVTLILSNNANWDATTAVLKGIDYQGNLVSENLSIPDAGNTTLTSTNYFAQVLSLTIPAQSGTGGTYTIGVAALDTLDLTDFIGVAKYEPVKEPASPGVAEFGDCDVISVYRKGPIWCIAEVLMAPGDSVYVRTSAGTFSTLGTFRNDSDSSSATQHTTAEVEDYFDDGVTKLVKIRF